MEPAGAGPCSQLPSISADRFLDAPSEDATYGNDKNPLNMARLLDESKSFMPQNVFQRFPVY
jgi:hypothetical protein